MDRLLRAASEEFKKGGYAGATTANIARNADITEAQLFRYFPSKADLFREAVFKPLNEHFQQFSARHPSGAGHAESSRGQARHYITELQEFLSEHSQMLLSLVVTQAYGAGDTKSVSEIDSLRIYFEQGAADMTRRMDGKPKVDPGLMVRASFAAVLASVLFRDWIFPPGLASDEEINAATIDFVIDGINANSDPGMKRE